MDKTIEDIMTRRSVRDFAKKGVSREDLETIVEAALSAPSACGKRPWHVVVIEDAKTRKRVTEAMEWFKPVEEAGAAILVCGEPDKSFLGNTGSSTAPRSPGMSFSPHAPSGSGVAGAAYRPSRTT